MLNIPDDFWPIYLGGVELSNRRLQVSGVRRGREGWKADKPGKHLQFPSSRIYTTHRPAMASPSQTSDPDSDLELRESPQPNPSPADFPLGTPALCLLRFAGDAGAGAVLGSIFGYGSLSLFTTLLFLFMMSFLSLLFLALFVFMLNCFLVKVP